MRRVLLHVGYPKTATTWLQKVVLPRHDQLALLRHRSSGCDWIQRVLADHALDFDPERYRAAIEESLRAAAGRVAFISHEAYLGDPFLGAPNGEASARRLHTLFPDARVLIVIREQGAMIDSLYRQYVQEGGTASPQQLFADPSALRVRFARGYLAYDGAVDRFAAHFGRERVRVMLFEDLRASPQRFVDELCEMAGVAPLSLGGADSEARNVGLSPPSLRLLRVANRLLESSFQPRALLPIRSRSLRRFLQRRVDPLLASRRDRPVVPESLRESLRESYRPNNRRLRDELGLAVDAAGYAV